jgi:hypothetical protein
MTNTERGAGRICAPTEGSFENCQKLAGKILDNYDKFGYNNFQISPDGIRYFLS